MEQQRSKIVRGVIWTAAGAPVPAELVRVLEKRGLTSIHAESAFAAFAELCIAQRIGDKSALILCDIDDPSRVLDGIERFAPDAIVWIFEPGANRPLRPFVVEVAARLARPAVEVSAKPALGLHGRDIRDEQPVAELKLTSRDSVEAPEPVHEPAQAPANRSSVAPEEASDERSTSKNVSARDVLEDAELEMLLASERGSGDHRR
ncbi:MAG: hypothetical protein AB8F26_13100 [Phycisphaerales bacterium]